MRGIRLTVLRAWTKTRSMRFGDLLGISQSGFWFGRYLPTESDIVLGKAGGIGIEQVLRSQLASIIEKQSSVGISALGLLKLTCQAQETGSHSLPCRSRCWTCWQ